MEKLIPISCDYNSAFSARYVTKDAAAAHNEWIAEQEAIAAAEAAEEYEYVYEDEEMGSGMGEYEYEECLVCEEDENPAPRFFFSQISEIFNNRNLPCCKDEDMNRQTETTTEPTGPR